VKLQCKKEGETGDVQVALSSKESHVQDGVGVGPVGAGEFIVLAMAVLADLTDGICRYALIYQASNLATVLTEEEQEEDGDSRI